MQTSSERDFRRKLIKWLYANIKRDLQGAPWAEGYVTVVFYNVHDHDAPNAPKCEYDFEFAKALFPNGTWNTCGTQQYDLSLSEYFKRGSCGQPSDIFCEVPASYEDFRRSEVPFDDIRRILRNSKWSGVVPVRVELIDVFREYKQIVEEEADEEEQRKVAETAELNAALDVLSHMLE